MFWVISHCYEVIFHLWQSLSERGEPVREGPELSVSRSDLSTFSVIHFLLWSRAREPSNLCPGTGMTRRQSLLWLITRINISRSGLAVLTPGSWQLLTQFPVILTALTPGADRGTDQGTNTLLHWNLIRRERPSDKCQVTMSEWKRTIILYFAQEWDNYIQLNYLQNESCKLCFLFLLTRRHSVHRAQELFPWK